MREPPGFTIGGLAKRYGLPAWKVRRIFERGLIPEPARLGAYRVVAVRELPQIEDALRKAGYLKAEAVPA
jgi:hypothetical protein